VSPGGFFTSTPRTSPPLPPSASTTGIAPSPAARRILSDPVRSGVGKEKPGGIRTPPGHCSFAPSLVGPATDRIPDEGRRRKDVGNFPRWFNCGNSAVGGLQHLDGAAGTAVALSILAGPKTPARQFVRPGPHFYFIPHGAGSFCLTMEPAEVESPACRFSGRHHRYEPAAAGRSRPARWGAWEFACTATAT
jgi:hypothetical protein